MRGKNGERKVLVFIALNILLLSHFCFLVENGISQYF